MNNIKKFDEYFLNEELREGPLGNKKNIDSPRLEVMPARQSAVDDDYVDDENPYENDIRTFNTWYEENEDGRAWDVFQAYMDKDMSHLKSLVSDVLMDLYTEGELENEPNEKIIDMIVSESVDHKMFESKLKFTDGEEFDTSGEYRSEKRYDGWYVLGHGRMIPVKDEEEADKLIDKLEGKVTEKLNESVDYTNDELVKMWNNYMKLVDIIDGIISEHGELPDNYWSDDCDSDLDFLTDAEITVDYIRDNIELIKKNFNDLLDGLSGWVASGHDIDRYGSLNGIDKNIMK